MFSDQLLIFTSICAVLFVFLLWLCELMFATRSPPMWSKQQRNNIEVIVNAFITLLVAMLHVLK